MYKYLSQEWLDYGKDLINKDAKFKEIAGVFSATFFHEVLNAPENQVLNYVSVFKNGHCENVYLGSIQNPTFKISGTYEDWVALHRGEANIIKLVMQGRLSFEGTLDGQTEYNKIIIAMMELFPKIPTIF